MTNNNPFSAKEVISFLEKARKDLEMYGEENIFLQIAFDFTFPILKNIIEILITQQEKLEELYEAMRIAEVTILGADGRSLYVSKVFLNRLAHILEADEKFRNFYLFSRDDTTSKPVSKNDLFIAISGSGETSVVLSSVQNAKKAGATIVVFSSNPKSSIAKLADNLIIVPGRSDESEAILPMGTKFEITVLLLLEIFNAWIIKKDNVVGAETKHFNC